MAFMERRNPNLPKAWKNIAQLYKQHGERLKVRWDYAFYQMLIETNYLTYRTGGGSWGDVNPRQNNFAGIGTTGGGVPGDRFKTASDGVLGQIQHLVAYSGERVERPVAERTREVQDDVISKSRTLGRAVTFRDLAGRWAVDRAYGRSIESVAARFRDGFCTGEPESVVAAASPGSKGKRSRDRRARLAEPEAEEPETLQEVASTRAPAKVAARRRGIEEMDEPPSPTTKAAGPPATTDGDEAEAAPSDGEEAVIEADGDAAPADGEEKVADGQDAPDEPAPPRRTAAAADAVVAPGPPARAPVMINGANARPPAAQPATRSASSGPAAPAAVKPAAKAPAQAAPTIASLIEQQQPATPPRVCKVWTASYGGERNVIIQAPVGDELHLTALQVLDGKEEELVASFIESHAQGGRRIGDLYPTREAALLKAFDLCPRSARVSQPQ